MIGTIGGALMFLTFMFMAVHVVLYLVATSVATTAALEAARYASAEGDDGLDPARRDEAEAIGRDILGASAPADAIAVHEPSPGVVQAQVSMPALMVFAPLVAAVPGLGTIDRGVQYRLEGEV